ncbi:MAG: c-type cytochrome biogenesis protein CcmI [Rhizobiales bacterium]|nr:c-type cytochrome biogenesis protein CcmI [Hyphomicrobiales bacterium]
MILWVIFALMTAAVVVYIARPLFSDAAGRRRAEYDVEVYRSQLSELDRDRDNGVIDVGEAEAARTEIARRLLAADARIAQGGVASRTAIGARLGLALVGIALPALSLGLYLVLGAPELPARPLAERMADPIEGKRIEFLVAQVEARLRSNPDDGRGWDVVGPVYLRLERYDDAAEAFVNAIRLEGESVRRLMGFAEATTKAAEGVIGPRVRVALERVLALEPGVVEARFWLAVADEQDGDKSSAETRYRELLASAAADAPWRDMVSARLAALATGGSRSEANAGAGETTRSPTPTGSGGPSAADVAAAAAMSADERAQMIRGMVDGLAARLAENGADLAGWQRLVRAYRVLGETQKADAALAEARGLFVGDPAALSALEGL